MQRKSLTLRAFFVCSLHILVDAIERGDICPQTHDEVGLLGREDSLVENLAVVFQPVEHALLFKVMTRGPAVVLTDECPYRVVFGLP